MWNWIKSRKKEKVSQKSNCVKFSIKEMGPSRKIEKVDEYQPKDSKEIFFKEEACVTIDVPISFPRSPTMADYLNTAVGFWKDYNPEDKTTFPNKSGKYLVCRKDGKIHFEKYNGINWAYNDNSIIYYSYIQTPI